VKDHEDKLYRRGSRARDFHLDGGILFILPFRAVNEARELSGAFDPVLVAEVFA
jgi:hypothetical protein